MQMGLLTFSDMDCFVIFYPLYLSVHGTLIQQISMVNNPPVENPFGMVRVAGFRMPQVERRKEWYAFCAFLVCLLIGTNDFFMQHLDSVPVFP